MRAFFSDEKINLLAPILIVLLVFSIPISSSVKSILMVLSLLAIVFTPYYRQYLYEAFNTLWARAALVFFLYIIIACFWSDAPLAIRYNTIDKYSKLIFLPILAVAFIKPSTRQWVLDSYLSVMLLTCILSILKARNLLELNNVADPGEVFYNHIITGYMVALGVYLAGLQVFKADVSRPRRLFSLSMFFLGSYQILFLNTGKTGYLIYALLMTMLMLQRMSLKKALVGVMLFFGTILLTYTLSPRMQVTTQTLFNDIKSLQNHQENNSLGFRIQFHQYAESLFKEHPFIGIGTGGFPYRFSLEQPVPAWGKKLNEPHGQYWLTLAEQGLIGITLLFSFLGTLFITFFKLKETKPILLGLLISFCFSSFTDTVFCYSTIGYLLIIFSALCFGELLEMR
ncbi:O-antigen biosynthesis protein [Legionella sainthelensi]|uniref:O-antigen biosynthesis protein n=1 Tax=Legionella sainthelensi TaxID=28087 RepID=A0A0W0YPP9_9GAMM|nr:O-antigen ligase family protein [Legionella sainthelensi]KTD58821.1 O-antigen biosynthesis protein [Legionella sainthelensi]VEH34073.1 O-antigen biosynthesis protein [Legionella sainthelensi]